MFTIFAVLLVIGLFIVLPLALITLIYVWLDGKNKKLAVIISIALLILFAFFLYRVSYPSDKFYINNFENYTEFEFPQSGKIIEKISSTSLFDFGDYALCLKINLNDSDYEKLNEQIKKSKFIEANYYLEGPEIETLISIVSNPRIEKIYKLDMSGMAYYIMTLDDKNSVILYYAIW